MKPREQNLNRNLIQLLTEIRTLQSYLHHRLKFPKETIAKTSTKLLWPIGSVTSH